MTATAVASCPCIPDEVFCAWSGCINKLNWTGATQYETHEMRTTIEICRFGKIILEIFYPTCRYVLRLRLISIQLKDDVSVCFTKNFPAVEVCFERSLDHQVWSRKKSFQVVRRIYEDFVWCPLSPACATFLVDLCTTITRQPIELESCWNRLKMLEVLFKKIGFCFLWVTSWWG